MDKRAKKLVTVKMTAMVVCAETRAEAIGIAWKLLQLECDDGSSEGLVTLYTGKQSEVAEEVVLGWVGSLFRCSLD